MSNEVSQIKRNLKEKDSGIKEINNKINNILSLLTNNFKPSDNNNINNSNNICADNNGNLANPKNPFIKMLLNLKKTIKIIILIVYLQMVKMKKIINFLKLEESIKREILFTIIR